jgi:hypothetical protein
MEQTMKVAIASTLAAAILAASSLAFAADNNNGGKDGMKTDAEKTGSINNNDGNTVSIEDREFCLANPGDSKCQNLGGEDNNP